MTDTIEGFSEEWEQKYLNEIIEDTGFNPTKYQVDILKNMDDLTRQEILLSMRNGITKHGNYPLPQLLQDYGASEEFIKTAQSDLARWYWSNIDIISKEANKLTDFEMDKVFNFAQSKLSELGLSDLEVEDVFKKNDFFKTNRVFTDPELRQSFDEFLRDKGLPSIFSIEDKLDKAPDEFNIKDLDPEGKGDWYKFRAGDFKNNPDMLMNAMIDNKFKEIAARIDPNDLENLLEFQEVAQPLEFDIQVENQALAGNPKAQDLVVESFSKKIDDYKNVTLASDEVLEKTISKKIVSEVISNAPGWIIVPAEQMVESALKMAGNPKAAAIAGKLVRYELTMFALSLAAGAIGAGAGAMGTLQGVQSNLLLGNEKELEKRLENVESDMIENAAAVGSGMMQGVMKAMPSYWLDEWLLKKYPAFEGWKEMFPQAAVATDWITNLAKGFKK